MLKPPGLKGPARVPRAKGSKKISNAKKLSKKGFATPPVRGSTKATGKNKKSIFKILSDKDVTPTRPIKGPMVKPKKPKKKMPKKAPPLIKKPITRVPRLGGR